MKISEIGLTTSKEKVNKVIESRFGAKIDYSSLTVEKAQSIIEGLTSSLAKFNNSHNTHVAHKNPKYVECFMIKEGLTAWLKEHHQKDEDGNVIPHKEEKVVLESETAQAEAVLAGRDMVDSVQDMMEKIGRMQNEQMPALLDSIHDQISAEQAEAFKTAVDPVLAGLEEQLRTGRETLDGAARSLAGEEVAGAMDMPAEEPAVDPEAPAEEPAADADASAEVPADDFEATDAAAGGEEDAGREERV